ncbi:MAG: hypothetical protein IPG04_32600 [Polyangiaceae bacterium]|nr:hypothetical protein [Polyangiaceae bacterium]
MERWLDGPRGRVLTLALCVAALLPLWASLLTLPVVPTHDGPKNLYASHVLTHLGEAHYAEEYEASFAPTTLAFTGLYGLLDRLIGWRLAYAVTIGVGVSLLPLGVYLIARTFDARRAPLALLGVAAAYGWTSHMGFINYVPSVSLGFVTIGVGLAARQWSLRRELGVYALLTLCSLYHPVGAQIAALSLFVFRFLNLTPGRVVRELGAMVLGCMPAGLVTLLANDALNEQKAKGLTGLHLDLTLFERLEGFTRWFLSGPLFRSVFVLAFAALGLGVSLARLGRGARQPSAWDGRSVALLAVAGFGIAGAMVAPMHSSVWQYMQPRFLPIAVMASVVLVPIEALTAAKRAVLIAATFVHALASNVWVAGEHARIVERDRAAFSAFGATHPAPGRTFLPIVALTETTYDFQSARDRPIPHASFLMNLGVLYAIDRQAITPYTFTTIPGVHAVTTKNVRMPRTPKRDYGKLLGEIGAPAEQRTAELVRLASFGTVFDDVMFYGAEPDAVEVLSHGYEVEVRGEGFFIGRFVGCPGRITVRGEMGTDGAVFVGWPGAQRIVESIPLTPPLPRTFDIPRASCKGLAVLVEGKAANGDLRCSGAEAGGFFTQTPPTVEVVCDLEVTPPAKP